VLQVFPFICFGELNHRCTRSDLPWRSLGSSCRIGGRGARVMDAVPEDPNSLVARAVDRNARRKFSLLRPYIMGSITAFTMIK